MEWCRKRVWPGESVLPSSIIPTFQHSDSNRKVIHRPPLNHQPTRPSPETPFPWTWQHRKPTPLKPGAHLWGVSVRKPVFTCNVKPLTGGPPSGGHQNTQRQLNRIFAYNAPGTPDTGKTDPLLANSIHQPSQQPSPDFPQMRTPFVC
jgi:hypothetical protein